jgi:hypothetical protein
MCKVEDTLYSNKESVCNKEAEAPLNSNCCWPLKNLAWYQVQEL